MESPLVSFIVVSYNHSKFITECLDSIRDQSYKEWELIVADDASKDNSADVMRDWLKENSIHAKTNFHTQNKGFAATLNECVELAVGKYVNIIAADDYLHPDFLIRCVDALEQKDDNFAVAFSSAFLINEDKSLTNYNDNFDFYNDPLQFRKELRKKNHIPALSTLVKRQVLLETGPYDKDILIEDYDRWLRINEKYLFVLIPENLAYYRRHDENISKIKARIIFLEETLLKIKYDTTLDNKFELNQKIKKLYSTSTDKKEIKKISGLYDGYRGKNLWLNFCLKHRLPYKFYLLKYKFF